MTSRFRSLSLALRGLAARGTAVAGIGACRREGCPAAGASPGDAPARQSSVTACDGFRRGRYRTIPVGTFATRSRAERLIGAFGGEHLPATATLAWAVGSLPRPASMASPPRRSGLSVCSPIGLAEPRERHRAARAGVPQHLGDVVAPALDPAGGATGRELDAITDAPVRGGGVVTRSEPGESELGVGFFGYRDRTLYLLSRSRAENVQDFEATHGHVSLYFLVAKDPRASNFGAHFRRNANV